MHLSLLALALLATADPESPPRKPSAIAPSLPALTREEEDRLDEVIDQFILADTGQLRGPEARKAMAAFDKLGMESVPALIRGLNRSARINHSCPVLMISKKLATLLGKSDDPVLLDFARDEIGATVTRTPHARVLQDLRVRLALRRNALAERPVVLPAAPSKMTTRDLAAAVPKLRGPTLAEVLRELGTREEKEALLGLALAAAGRDRDLQMLAREMLDQVMARQTLSMVKEWLLEGPLEIRRSAIRVAGEKHEDLTLAIIDRLTDPNPALRAEAHATLKKLAGSEDFGPGANASRAELLEAQKRWKAWWLKKTEK
ncbi:MAG: hypothetical protein U0840_18890 [Gemmataceae bacterium]